MLRLGRKLYEDCIVRKIVFISKKTGVGVRTLSIYKLIVMREAGDRITL
nr:MAG TPA: hypothetical protein [Caudoviricetes sp.]